jgi:hypothetical protein
LLKLLTQLKKKGAPVDAYGMQGHFELGDDSIAQLRATFDELRKLNIKVVVSELDIDVVTRGRWWADDGKHREELATFDPYKDGIPTEIQKEQIEQYVALFKLFVEYNDIIERVSFWNLHDGQSWLNYFPWQRVNHPLLFDRHRQPKPVFDAIFQTLREQRDNRRRRGGRGFGGRIVLGPDDIQVFADPPAGITEKRDAIPYGKLEMIEYDSKTVGTTRNMNVYTPPGYAADKQYPVLYLLHEIGGDETEWKRYATPDILLDNLIADGNAEPMIVVMPNGPAQKNDRAVGNVFAAAPAFTTFERDLLDDVIPTIESRYHTHTDREKRALA